MFIEPLEVTVISTRLNGIQGNPIAREMKLEVERLCHVKVFATR
jgi:hypothetical protein